MISFWDYLELLESSALEPVGIEDKKMMDSPPDTTKGLSKVAQLAWDRYRAETREFFSQLSNKDPDIKDEFDKIDKGETPDRVPHKFGGEQDIIAPPEADSAQGDEGMEGGE